MAISLPTFIDGAFLSATDLNQIGRAQALIYTSSAASSNMPVEYMIAGVERHLVHRYRYLHWETEASTGAQLKLNGTTTIATAGTSGVVDLDSYGLTLGSVYSLVWSGTVVCTYIAEKPSSATGITLPFATPSFGGTITEDDLNAVSGNTAYLQSLISGNARSGFVGRLYSAAFGMAANYGITHQSRYLYFDAELYYSGTQGTDEVHTNLRINNNVVWSDICDGTNSAGGSYMHYVAWIDLNGSDHENIGTTGNGLAQPPGHVDVGAMNITVGDRYKATIEVTEAGGVTELRTKLLAEFSEKTIN